MCPATADNILLKILQCIYMAPKYMFLKVRRILSGQRAGGQVAEEGDALTT